MSVTVPVVLRVRAEVNGERFEMRGEGVGGAADGTCTLHVNADPGFPKGFDPVSCPSICNHPLSIFFARAMDEEAEFASVTGGAYAVSPARRGIVYDSTGKALLDLEVSGTMRFEDGRFVIDQDMRGFSQLPALERNVTPFEDYLVPSGDGATALVRFGLLTKAGETLDGICTVPYRWTGGRRLGQPLARRVEEIAVEWDGANRVSAYFCTEIRSLHAAADDAAVPAISV